MIVVEASETRPPDWVIVDETPSVPERFRFVTLMVDGSEAVTAPVEPLTVIWFAVPANEVTGVEFAVAAVIMPDEATVTFAQL